MSGFKNKTDLLKTLLSDYYKNSGSVENSFIYRYLKNRKDKAALRISDDKAELYAYREKPRREKYILLRAAYLARKNGVIEEREYADIFAEVAKKERGAGKFTNMFIEDPDDAQRKIEAVLIRGSVEDYFSNQGFRVQIVKNEYAPGEQSPKESFLSMSADKSRKKHGGYIDDIEIAYEFEHLTAGAGGASEYPQQASDAFGGGVTEEHILKCGAIFNAAKASRSGDVVIPLYFEPTTGAGIYIIGNKYLKNQNDDCCAVFALWFSSLDQPETDGFFDEFNEMPMEVMWKAYDSVFEAFEKFPDGIDDYCINYSDLNSKVPLNEKYSSFARLLVSEPERRMSARDEKIIEAEKIKENNGLAIQKHSEKIK